MTDKLCFDCGKRFTPGKDYFKVEFELKNKEFKKKEIKKKWRALLKLLILCNNIAILFFYKFNF